MFQELCRVRFVVARRVLWWPIVLGARLGIKRIAAARLHQARHCPKIPRSQDPKTLPFSSFKRWRPVVEHVISMT